MNGPAIYPQGSQQTVYASRSLDTVDEQQRPSSVFQEVVIHSHVLLISGHTHLQLLQRLRESDVSYHTRSYFIPTGDSVFCFILFSSFRCFLFAILCRVVSSTALRPALGFESHTSDVYDLDITLHGHRGQQLGVSVIYTKMKICLCLYVYVIMI